MNKLDKIAFAIGAVLTKKMGQQIAVCRVGNAVEWRLPQGGYAVGDLSTVAPKETLGKAYEYLTYQLKLASKGK